MQQLSLKQQLKQKLSPQQLQAIRLLQVPAMAMKSRIEQELVENPALEEVEEVALKEEADGEAPSADWSDAEAVYKPRQRSKQDWINATVSNRASLQEQLLEQLQLLPLSEQQRTIGAHLIGSMERDGYIRRDLEAIANDLALTQYLEVSVSEVVEVLQHIQQLDPPGVGARNLQECLLIQMQKQPESLVQQLALQILQKCFVAFSKKQYDQMAKQLQLADRHLLQKAVALIAKLDPKPGQRQEEGVYQSPLLYPDFMVTQHEGKLEVTLQGYHIPKLQVRKRYEHMLQASPDSPSSKPIRQEVKEFVKKKLTAAHWFIEAIKQRRETLLRIMNTIVKLQATFFVEGDVHQLRPMVLRHIAEAIDMDVSTVSRVVSNKSVQTDFGIYPLRFFFTEGIAMQTGDTVSSRAVKQQLAQLIREEDKSRPLTDEQLVQLLRAQGYRLARRTVAKYRVQMRMPVARLRRQA